MSRTYLSALALAATLTTTGNAQAADFQVDDRTTLSVFGAVELGYKVDDVIDDNGDEDSESDLIDNGSVIGVGAEHRFESGLTAYVSTEFEFDMLGDTTDGDGGEFTRDESYVGLRGDFGDVRFGQYDNILFLVTYDLLDPFENVSLTGEEPLSGDDRTVAYFSPDFNGFSFNLQSRVVGDAAENSASDSSEYSLIGVVNYEADFWSVHAGVDDRGTAEADDEISDDVDPSYGLSATLAPTDRLGLVARYSVADQTDDNDDPNETAYYGALVTYDYGPGQLYGGAQQIDPDEGDEQTQFAGGVNYFVEDNLYVYGEYGSFDASAPSESDDTSLDARYQVGAVYEF